MFNRCLKSVHDQMIYFHDQKPTFLQFYNNIEIFSLIIFNKYIKPGEHVGEKKFERADDIFFSSVSRLIGASE